MIKVIKRIKQKIQKKNLKQNNDDYELYLFNIILWLKSIKFKLKIK